MLKLRIIKLNEESKKNILNDLLKRSPNNYDSYAATVQEIVNNVRENGDKAVAEYTLKFDKTEVNASNILVTKDEIREAYDYINNNDEGLVEVIKKSAKNIEEYHSHNTARLDVEGMKQLLLKLNFIREDLGLQARAKARDYRSE